MRQADHSHPSDADLLMLSDGELSPPQADAMRAHLASCWSCRARSKELEEAITGFVREQRESSFVPPADGPRALLRARLAELTPHRPASHWRHPLTWVSMAAAVALLLAVGVALREPGFSARPVSEARQRPDPKLTPGSVVLASAQQVCTAGSTDEAAVIPAAFGHKVFQAYGIRRPKARAYELDSLIPPELGGSADIRNFWPQPYSPEWNARLKDALEDRLHELVCAGEISLEAAQREIATDWIAAYKKYFRTEVPQAAHYAFAKDKPWE